MRGAPLRNLLTNRNFIFPLGIILGFTLGENMAVLKDVTPYIIGFILAISVSSYRFRSFAPVVGNFGPIMVCTFLSFVAYNAVILPLAWLLVDDPMIRIGFVIIAATPPAIAVIPFSINLGGDARYSITGVFGGNFMAMALTPLIFFIFLGEALVSTLDLLFLLIQILITPILLSRLLRRKKILTFVEKIRGTVIDYGYFMVSMIVIGMNRPLIISEPYDALISLLILFFSMFVLGFIYKRIIRKWVYDKEVVISTNLMLTMKNAGFAAVVAISLFSDMHTAMPAAILSVLIPLYYLYESNIQGRKRSSGRLKA